MRNVDLYARDMAVLSDRGSCTWAELVDHVTALASALSRDGVGVGSRVAVMQRNGYELVELAYAVAILGAILVPVSPRLAPAEVDYVVQHAQPTISFVEAEHPALGSFGGGQVIDTWAPDYVAYRDSCAGSAFHPNGEAAMPVMQLYTSGTTGRPKAVSVSQRSMIQLGLSLQLSQGLRHDDVYLAATPLTHAASGTRIFSMGMDGIALAVIDRFTPELFFAAVERFRVTSTILVAKMMFDILDSDGFGVADLSSLRSIVYGAGPTPEPLVRRAIEQFPCGLIHGYGSTEGSPGLTALSAQEHVEASRDPLLAHRLRSVGRPVQGVRIRIVRGDGAVAPKGEIGELQVRSTRPMLEYVGDPASMSSVISLGWLRTGDLGWQDDDGYLYVAGRTKEMMISGGLNVYPAEIERVLLDDPAVAAAAVIGAADGRWGEVPLAFVELRTAEPGADVVTRLAARCRAELAGYKQPKRITVLEALPRTDSGKIRKVDLVDRGQI